MIKIVACGFCTNNNQPSQLSGAAVKLTYVDEFNRTAIRTIKAPTGNSTRPQSEIKAAILGLSAIICRFKSAPIQLYIPTYVAGLLKKVDGIYKANANKNADLVGQLRSLFDTFSSITIFSTPGELKDILQLSKNVAETQIGGDSGTVLK